MSVIVNRAGMDDLCIFKQLYTELCETQEPNEYGEIVSSPVLIQDKVNAWFTQADVYHPYILLKDDEPIGIALMNLHTERAVIDMWHVGIMYIREAYRRQGVGEKLLRTLIEKYSGDNLDFTINVFAWNEAAIRLYEKVGFRPRSFMMKLANAKDDLF